MLLERIGFQLHSALATGGIFLFVLLLGESELLLVQVLRLETVHLDEPCIEIPLQFATEKELGIKDIKSTPKWQLMVVVSRVR